MKTVIIGSGKVASWFVKIFQQHNHEIIQVYSRVEKNASKLAKEIYSSPINNLKAINTTADLYLIAVADDAIQNIIDQLPKVNGIVINTAGSKDIAVLNKISDNYGVMWPMLSVTQNIEKKSDFVMVTESSNDKTAEKINELSSYFTDKIISLSLEKRQILHLSAVFANNFTNFLISISQKILIENEIDISIVHTMLNNMVNQLEDIPAYELQTGPALRNDTGTMESHLQLLKNHPERQEIYKLLSEKIKEFYTG